MVVVTPRSCLGVFQWMSVVVWPSGSLTFKLPLLYWQCTCSCTLTHMEKGVRSGLTKQRSWNVANLWMNKGQLT